MLRTASFALILALAGCTTAQVVTNAQAIADCEAPAVVAEMAKLETTLISVLTNLALSQADLKAQLDAFVAYQPTAAICEIGKLAGALQVGAAAPLAGASPVSPAAILARSNAATYLVAKASGK